MFDVDNTTNSVYVMLEDRLDSLFKKADEYTTLEKMKGASLVGKKYRPLFSYFQHLKSDEPDQGAFRIVRYTTIEAIMRLSDGMEA